MDVYLMTYQTPTKVSGVVNLTANSTREKTTKT